MAEEVRAPLAGNILSVLVEPGAVIQEDDELLVIDQSPDDESQRRVDALFAPAQRTTLVYVHDPRIAGLVAAKQAAVARARGDIVCFLEDDVALDPDYLFNIERVSGMFNSFKKNRGFRKKMEKMMKGSNIDMSKLGG